MYEYTHTPLSEEVTALAGSYQKVEESRLAFQEREVLCFVGSTGDLCTCCGTCSSFQCIKVPGYVKAWRYQTNEQGLPLSTIEPVRSEEEKKEIAKILQEKYQISQVEFW